MDYLDLVDKERSEENGYTYPNTSEKVEVEKQLV